MPLPKFVKTARALFLLTLLVVGWGAALWFIVVPDFSTWSLPRLAVVHVAPPFVAWSIWCWGCRRRQQRNAARAVRQEELAAQERQAALEAARVQHAAEQRRLQFGCDCLGLAMVTTATTDEPPAPAGDCIHVATIDKHDLTEANDLLEQLHPGIDEALGALYSQCGAAAHFPIYLAPPSDMSGEAVIATVRQVQARFLDGPGVVKMTTAPVVFLPQRDSVADSLISLFETNPELPGAVILAFDSPWWRAQRLADDDDRQDGESTVRDGLSRWLGAPGQGVIALFVTHPELPAMLINLTRQQHPDDPMTPYWERLVGSATPHSALARLSDREYDTLRAQTPLARIHRSASTQLDASDAKQSLRQGFAQDVATLIERAQIHATQIHLSLDAKTPVIADETSSSSPATRCDWLVHNTGSVDCGGPRLASLGVALIKRGFDLDPIDAATNVVVNIGDLGQARSLGMLALAVARTAAEGAVLCAEFSGDERLSLFFAQPPTGAAA